MSTLAASIQAQITVLDTQLASISPTSASADGTSVTNPDWIALSKRRVELENLLNKANGVTMFPRGVLTGLR